MDKIQSPSLGTGKNRNPYQPKNSGFDPKAFMREQTKLRQGLQMLKVN